jgi:hypothetical protein
MEYLFDREKLKAYQQAIQFVAWVKAFYYSVEKIKSLLYFLEK